MQANNKASIIIKTLGEIVRELRQKSNKSIYKIAAEASMSKSTWREVEVFACNNINLTTFWKIAEGLEIPPEILLIKLKEKLPKDFSLIDE